MLLSKLFSSNKPFTYVILAVVLLLFYSVHLYFGVEISYNQPIQMITTIVSFAVIISTLLLVQYMIAKHKLNDNNLYGLFFYVCFLLLFPSYFDSFVIVMVNFFLLLSLQFILTLQYVTNHKKWLFDASFYLAIAVLIQPITALFFILIYYGIIWQSSKDYRNALVPIVAFLMTLALAWGLEFVVPSISLIPSTADFKTSFTFDYFTSEDQRIALSLYAGLLLQLLLWTFVLRRKIKQHYLFKYYCILLFLLISIVVFLFANDKSNALLAYTFFPMATIAGDIIVRIKRIWFREIVLWLMLIACVSLFFIVTFE